MKLKTYSIVLTVHIILIFNSCSKSEIKDKVVQKKTTTLSAQAEIDFKKIDSLKNCFCDYPEECERYENGTFLESRRFKDKVAKNLMRLSETFLDSYPEDPHYNEVLKFFFNMTFEPLFIPEKISDSVTVLLSKDNLKYTSPIHLQQLRALPKDKQSCNDWLEKGHELAEKFLNSNAPLERKLEIEIAVLARDFRSALLQYQSLDMQKEGVEAGFWERFDKDYWESFRLRINDLLEKYSDLEVMASYVQQFIGLVKKFSPTLAEPYWKGFLKLTDTSNTLSNSKGFKIVHNMAKKNLRALKSVDDSKPLDIAFTAIDGSKIDLANMRGKVVLIDFWTISCGPCIKEMPYTQTMYDKYRSQGFEVIGIAGNDDTAKERVQEIIKKQHATWPQYLDYGKNATISYHSLYNIKSYPTVWLLNKEGKIVDKNARGMRLEPLIRKYLGLDK